jgi:hypothetical protein
MGGVRRESTIRRLYDPATLGGATGTIAPMSALWLLLVPVVLVGGFFTLRGFRRVSQSLRQLRVAMDDLAQAGVDLNKVKEEIANLGASVDEVRRR